MNNEPKPSRTAHVPGILMGTAALIAALSTLYVNLRDEPAPAPVVAAPMAVAPEATDPTAPARAGPQVVRMRLDRVQVDDDGSVGSTDWNFQVNVDGVPTTTVAIPDLSDRPGHNLVRLAEGAFVDVELEGSKSVALSVTGWKDGWLGGARGEVSGQEWLTTGATKAAVTLKGDKPKGPRFVVYFSAVPVE